MFIGEIINHQYRNRDNEPVKFKVISNNPDIICEYIDGPFYTRIGYSDNKDELLWIDPSGGPMIKTGDYTLCGYILQKIWVDKESNKILMYFK